MQFKDLFTLKNIRNLFVIVIVVFLVLPLMVPEQETVSVLKKETVAASEESPLPIFPRENLIERYKKQFKKIYLGEFNDITQTPQDTSEETENVRAAIDDISALDLFFSDDYIGEDDLFFANSADSNEFIDDKVNLQKGTVETSDGLIIEPTQEGYYYKGTFYKNGTYPKEANKTTIEGAINRYHTKVAQHLGKKALYYADENGKLTVDYVDKLPNEISTDIDTYLAQNTFKDTKKEFTKEKTLYAKAKNYSNNNYDKYRGARINGLNSRMNDGKNISFSDIAMASLQDMHAAYDMAINKIHNGEMGQDINIDTPQDNNQNNNEPENSEIEKALEETNIVVANDPEQTQENVCEGDKCTDSFRISPILDEEMSDLYAFYHSFCRETCPDHDRILEEDFTSAQGINALKEKLSDSDAKIVEIAYINENTKYENVLNNLKKEQLTNQNGEQVEVLLRKKEPIVSSENDSFGEKMIHPFKQNMERDFKKQPNPDVPIQDIVKRYNQIDQEIQEEEKNDSVSALMELSQDILGKDHKDIQVAIVEKSQKKNHYIINGPDIPNGYKTNIKEWEQYKVSKDDGSFYYEVPKNILLNAPLTTAIILVEDKGTSNLKFKDRNKKFIRTVNKDTVYSYNYDKVKETERVVLDAKLSLIQDMVNKRNQNEQKKNKKTTPKNQKKGNNKQ